MALDTEHFYKFSKKTLEKMVDLSDAMTIVNHLIFMTNDAKALKLLNMLSDEHIKQDRKLTELERSTIIWAILWIQQRY